jgi:DNA-binding HxlR family transcriptional regulator
MTTPRPEARPATNRPNVVRLPGPCSQWDEHDADFIREILDMIGDKWSVLIIGTLANGPVRYTTLANAIPGISARMLTLTLKHLNRSGLIHRTVFAEVPPKVEYTLTPLGTSLLTTVLELANWSAQHHTEISTHQANFDRQH